MEPNENDTTLITTTKTITLPTSTRHTSAVSTSNNKAKRVITTKKKWMFSNSELFLDKQFEYIENIYKNDISKENQHTCNIILKQIYQKVYGYKIQDQHKGLFDIAKFVDVACVIEKMMDCENRCFYCKNQVHVLYEYVREPRQWTLERIDNDFGHNKDNTVIACLSCNLHRRTMYHERYAFTKQMVITKT